MSEGNIPEPICFIARSMYNWCIVFRDCDQIFREYCSAIVIAQVADEDKRSGGEVL